MTPLLSVTNKICVFAEKASPVTALPAEVFGIGAGLHWYRHLSRGSTFAIIKPSLIQSPRVVAS